MKCTLCGIEFIPTVVCTLCPDCSDIATSMEQTQQQSEHEEAWEWSALTVITLHGSEEQQITWRWHTNGLLNYYPKNGKQAVRLEVH